MTKGDFRDGGSRDNDNYGAMHPPAKPGYRNAAITLGRGHRSRYYQVDETVDCHRRVDEAAGVARQRKLQIS